jgi:DNA-binding NarL/FixJ family response regulator
VIRVLIVAASVRVRRALESRLSPRSFEIIGSFATMQGAAEVSVSGVDAVLLEASERSMAEVVESLEETNLSREIPAVLLVQEASPEIVGELLRLGVRAVLPASAKPPQIAVALEAAVHDLVVLPRSGVVFARSVHVATPSALEELPEPLTPREREVLHLLASGLGNKEIGTKLQISEHTAKFHVASILGKLGASTRTEAVSLGMRHGLILL